MDITTRLLGVVDRIQNELGEDGLNAALRKLEELLEPEAPEGASLHRLAEPSE